MRFPERLREIRKKRGLTQKKLGAMLNYGSSAMRGLTNRQVNYIIVQQLNYPVEAKGRFLVQSYKKPTKQT